MFIISPDDPGERLGMSLGLVLVALPHFVTACLIFFKKLYAPLVFNLMGSVYACIMLSIALIDLFVIEPKAKHPNEWVVTLAKYVAFFECLFVHYCCTLFFFKKKFVLKCLCVCCVCVETLMSRFLTV